MSNQEVKEPIKMTIGNFEKMYDTETPGYYEIIQMLSDLRKKDNYETWCLWEHERDLFLDFINKTNNEDHYSMRYDKESDSYHFTRKMSYGSQLKPKQYQFIDEDLRQEFKDKFNLSEIYRKYGVYQSTLSHVVNGNRYLSRFNYDKLPPYIRKYFKKIPR